VLFPALRLGYVVIPSGLQPHFEAAISLTVRHTRLFQQLVLSEFISEGHFGRHLRRMREIYAERLSIPLQESRSRLSGLLEISDVEAGLQTVGWLSRGVAGETAAAAGIQAPCRRDPDQPL
jgi:GntR family transcriptional regulator / MocR family aminotransferase